MRRGPISATVTESLAIVLEGVGDAPSRSLDDLAHRLALPTEALAEAVHAADTADTGEALAKTGAMAEALREAAPPPFCHDGTERRIPRPTAPDAQKSCYSGKKKCHTVKNVLLVDVTLTILFLSETQHGSMQDKRIADATPYPLPSGSHLLQDLGFQAFSLEGVTAHTPHKKPRGGVLTAEQKESNRHLARRRIRIEHVNSSVKRCRIVKDTLRLLRAGVRDSVIEICSALHNFRVRLTPWLPMT